MITFISGDDLAKSRIYFKEILKNTRVLDGESLTLSDITDALSSMGLFQEEKIVGIENLFSKRKQSKELTTILEEVKKNEKENHIVFWEEKALTKKVETQFPRAISKSFTYPKSLFTFLDNLKPNNPRLLPLFHETLLHTEAELIFFMLTRQFRLLLALSDETDATIDEVKRLAPWQKQKLLSQSRQFSMQELLNHYDTMTTIDRQSKTGGSAFSLSQQIDFFLSAI